MVAVDFWVSNQAAATESFGDINTWDVSAVTDMADLLTSTKGGDTFNSDISGWDVSSVTGMEYMFSDASTFNADISGWNVSRVTSMGSMFYQASSFNKTSLHGTYR